MYNRTCGYFGGYFSILFQSIQLGLMDNITKRQVAKITTTINKQKTQLGKKRNEKQNRLDDHLAGIV